MQMSRNIFLPIVILLAACGEQDNGVGPHDQVVPPQKTAEQGDDCASPAPSQIVLEACELLERSMATFNSGDMEGWAETIHFPHLRLAGTQLQRWESAEDYSASLDSAALEQTGWSETRFETRRIVQAASGKVHVAARLARYGADSEKITEFDTLFVLTREDGTLGVKFRSSFAGTVGDNTPY